MLTQALNRFKRAFPFMHAAISRTGRAQLIGAMVPGNRCCQQFRDEFFLRS
jgi:hypothetical protein